MPRCEKPQCQEYFEVLIQVQYTNERLLSAMDALRETYVAMNARKAERITELEASLEELEKELNYLKSKEPNVARIPVAR